MNPIKFIDVVSIPDQVAACALHHYNTQLSGQKGKPKPHQEWTVYAAIVAFRTVSSELWVVSCATGTKCTTQRHAGCILHDGHAEVLARRGLIRVLWRELLDKKRDSMGNKEPSQVETRNNMNFPNMSILHEGSRTLLVDSSTNSESDNSANKNNDQSHKYKLDPNIELHLYISDSPCGDASIYAVKSNDAIDDSNGTTSSSSPPSEGTRSLNFLFTGAKVVVSKANGVDVTDCGGDHQLLRVPTTTVTEGTVPAMSTTTTANGGTENVDRSTTTTSSLSESITKTIAREEIQVLGKVRTKAGRSNLPDHMRSTSMSCSDKIVLWGALGMQGSILTKYLDPPILTLRSVVVSRDVRLDGDNGHNQLAALQRAISDRVAKVWDSVKIKEESSSMGTVLPEWRPKVPILHIVSQTFENGKAAMAPVSTCAGTTTNHQIGHKRKREEEDGAANDQNVANSTKVSPCGMSLNWNQSSSDLEVVIGARGIKQGKKPKSGHDYKALASRLSRSKLLLDFLLPMDVSSSTLHPPTNGDGIHTIESYGQQNNANHDTDRIQSYYKLKEVASCQEWMVWKKRILSEEGGGPLAGWLRSVDDGTGDFNPHDNVV